MSIDYAKKFSPKVQENFTKDSFTGNAINRDYDFIGVNTVKIYSVGTVGMTNYTKTGGYPGTSRYGAINELSTSIQELQLKNDRSFTFAIDKRDDMDAMGVLNPGKALERQIKERVIPEVDEYRLAKIVDDLKAKRGKIVNAANLNNPYELFIDAVTELLNKNVPMAGCFAYICPSFYKKIRLDANFIKASDMAQEMLVKGQVGMIDGIPLILVPDKYFPTSDGTTTVSKWSALTNIATAVPTGKKVAFMLVNKAATVGAEKLVEYKVHDNPPGINGYLVEGRVCYDAFLLDKKADMVYVQTVDKSGL